MAGFKSFAKSLQVNFESKYDCPEIYRQLAEKYKSGVIIFDNVEGLETSDNVFGIYDFLPVEYECEHPIIIMTSRHGKFSLRGNTCNFKMINLESLSDNESYECLVNYLGIQNQEIVKTFQELISKLAANIQGYPLALSLVGKLIAGKAEAASFAGIEAKIRDYIKLFEEQSFADLFGKSALEEQIKIICKWTLDKMMMEGDGEVAFEILGIVVVMMKTDRLQTGLVHGIYFNQWFDEFRSNFRFEDANLYFRTGLKLLVTYSLVTLRDFRPSDNEYITMHRLIQSSVLEYLRSCPNSAGVIAKMCNYYTFCDNEVIYQNFSHFSILERTYPDFDGLFELGRSLNSPDFNHLIILNWFNLKRSEDFGGNLLPSQRNVIEAQFSYLKTQALDKDQISLLDLSEYSYQILTEGDYNASITMSQVEKNILSLTPTCSKKFWVIRCCVKILRFIQWKCREITEKSELCKWIKRSWKECESLDRPFIDIIRCVWNLGGCSHVDTDFIPSVLTLSKADTQLNYWDSLAEIFRYERYPERYFEVVNARVFSLALQQGILMSIINERNSECSYIFLLLRGIKSANLCKQLCNANFCQDLADALSNGLKFYIQHDKISAMFAEQIFKMLIVTLTLKKCNLCSCSGERLFNSMNDRMNWIKSYPDSGDILSCDVLANDVLEEAEEFLKLCVAPQDSRWINVVHEFFDVIDGHLTKFVRSAIEEWPADKFTWENAGGKTCRRGVTNFCTTLPGIRKNLENVSPTTKSTLQ